MSPYHRTPFPTSGGLSSRGLLCPLQDPSFAMHLLASVSRDERPVRLRGSVSVPIVPAPASATAAPLSDLEPVRGRAREYASLRCPPRRRDPARSRADTHSKRRTHGASRASRTSRFITDAGRPWHPLQGACRVDVTIAFDWPERRRVPMARRPWCCATPRLITACRGPVRARRWAVGRMSRCGIPSSVRSGPGGVAACLHRRGWVSVVTEGARFEEVYPERKLCHVPCVNRAVAGVDAVPEPVSRSPAPVPV